ncbi:MAG: SBBP repeat-containing protein [Bacteroidetes bacterium]|nr:SBBP repeat-containing protein [Bacteroidota bacterium]
MKTLSTLLLCTVYPVKFRIANYFIGATIFLATSFPHLGGQRGAAQSLQWAKSIGSNVGDMGYSITTDGSGNVYVTGYFSNTADFDPGPGTANLISVGAEDIFIAKYDAIGNYIWAKNIGSTGYDGARSIAVDDSGYVYITGDFRGTADFDPGPGTTNFTPIGVSGGFLAKYSASGNYLWAIIIDSPGDDRGYKITIDDSNKVFITGFFQGTTDFDPSAGIANLTIVGGYDIFVAKYDANGNYLWAKSIGSANTDFGYSIAVDDSVNVYTTGVFNGTADFDPGVGTYNLTSAGSPDIFISKLDALGNFVWAKKIGGTSGDESFSITTDTSGNIYSTGYFQGTVDFDPGTGTYNLTATGLEDIFISKLDASGNFLWAKAMGGTSSDEGFSITTDWSGNVYTTGYFEGTADFDPGTGQYNLTATNNNIFISKLDSSGNFFWAIAMGGAFSERGLSLATDGMGNVYTMGYFQGTADFDPDTSVADTTNLISAGSNDIFFAKYSQPPPCGSFTSTTTITNASCYECTNGSVSINVQGGGFPFIYSWSTGLTDTSVFNQYDLNSTVTANTFVTQPSPLTTFIKNFGGTGDDGASNIAATADGGYLLAGHAVSFGAGQTDVYLVKTDAAGNVQWSKTIGDVLWEWAHDIHQTSDGGYIITGEAGNTPPNDVFLIKTDSLGNVQWSTVYGDSLDEKGHAVRQTSDGGYIIAGETYTYGSGQNDLFLIKTGSTGVVQWSKAYGSTNYDYAKDVIETPGGGFVVAGSTRGYGAGSYDVYLLKTDINGNLLWTKTYGTSEDERGHSLQKTLDGGYAITGYSLDLSSGYSDVYFVKTDSNGVLQWDRLYGDALDERGESFVQTGDSGYFIAGYTYSFGAGGSDVYMLRTNAQGAQQWSNAIGGPLDDAGYEIIQSPDGGFAVAGLTLNNSAGSYDMRLIKTDELGTTPCNNQSVFTIENNPPDSTSTGGSLSIVSVFGNSSILTETSPATIDSLSCIFQCNLTISAALTAVSCNGSSDGSVTLIITGGTPPYEYFWNTGASNDTLTGLSAGTYYVTVSDLLSCLATDTIVVNVYKAGAWSQKAVLGDTARAGGVGFSIGTKGYIGTGRDTAFNDLKDFWEWDQATNVWTQKANFGGTARYAAVGFSIGAKGYIGTGTDIASVIKQDFWEWDQAGNTWTQKSDTSGLLRFNGVGFSIGAKGYIGTGNDGVRKQDFWEWNQATDTWTKKTNFGGTAREYAVGFSIGAKGFIGTGYDGIAPYKQDFWEWNQATDIWTPKANFSGGARDVAVGFSIGAKGYIGTGYDGVAKKDFWEWDQAGNTWTQKAGFGGTARYYAVGFSIGTKGYIGTGLDSAYTKDFWEFNPDTIFTLSFAKTDLSCFADTNGTATVIPAGGLTPHTYLWSTLSGFETLTGLTTNKNKV